MADIPQLKGLVTKDMVKTIGTGRYAAEYVPWSKIAELMQKHAPGWMPECVPNADGDVLHRAPVGGYLQIRFVHLDGTATPAYPQAVQDNRHAAIPYEKITARDLTDTQRRGWCLAAAAVFGIGVELWTRDALEQGYSNAEFAAETLEAPKAPAAAPKAAPAAKKAAPETTGGTSEATEAAFREAALAKGVDTRAIDAIVAKLGGKWEAGLKTLAAKSAEELNAKYAPAEDGEQW
ncbi:hypothetical protein S-CBS2_gp060 [Synechococcus phage S-CBS2]|uniref:hypothetical protein n=1 Tax=Synechococcus phage S-CBS2 TaxID=753084 RepID=UPI0002078415|nr:hypothetical protein S-CBS2_gp060 [Synechococcus phage S-CBS2]ADF42416.1 hypothetical protein S-CBS2_gp060 [Synechococcus phage S-CBS2]